MDEAAPKLIPVSPARDKARRHGRLHVGCATCDLGVIVDISASGMRVETGRRPVSRVGEVGPIEIEALGETFAVPGRIVWIRRIGFWKHAIGVEFGDLSPRAQHALVNLARSVTASDGYLRVMPSSEHRTAG